MDAIPTNRILRPNQAAEFLSISRATLWRFCKESDFPRKIHLGVKSVGWKSEELAAWVDSRKAA